MKKRKLFPILLTALALFSCSPDNGGNNNNNNNNNQNNDDNNNNDNTDDNNKNDDEEKVDDYDENATHDGTVNSPLSCKEASTIASNLSSSGSVKKYVYGIVSRFYKDGISSSYGNATFYMKSADTEFLVWRCKYYNGEKFTTGSEFNVGNKIILNATLINYEGKTPEADTSSCIYSINGKTKIDDSSDGTDDNNNNNNDNTDSDEKFPITDDVNEYYKLVTDDLTGGMNGTLRTTLTKISKPKASYDYSSGLAQLLPDSNEDPNNSSNMIYFYTHKSVKKNAASTWNREHTWPQSLSGGLYGKSGAGCDALHIMPTYNTTNSKRGNLKFGNCTNGTLQTYEGVNYAKTSGGYFEPMDSVKGDCARIVFYMRTTYFASRNHSITNVAQSIQTLLEWNKLDPVDNLERMRNKVVFASKQNNRNPFVDHPEWVDKIFG